MEIRKAKKEDFDKYSKLRIEGLKDYSRLASEKLKITSKQIKEEFDSIFASSNRFLIFIEEDKVIIGYLIGGIIKNPFQTQGYVDDIFIKRTIREKGYGTKLMNEFIKWAKNKGATRVRLGVRKNNKKAIEFYESLGFEIKHYEMEKELK